MTKQTGISVLLFLGLGGSLVACPPPARERPGGPNPDPYRVPPPPEILGFRCDRDPPVDDDQVNAITGGDTFENETHDCQRLVVDDGTAFGPLVGVFPLDQAMRANASGGFDGGPAASLLNFSANGDPTQAYPPFNLSEDPDDAWSCIEIDSFTDSDTQTSAKIYPLSAGTCNEGRPDSTATATGYAVRISTHPHEGAIPATARFRYDSMAEAHYIGMRCGSKWCSIYPPGVTPTEPVQWPQGSDPREVVPGWFDEQHLAIDSGRGWLIPGPWSRIEPWPDLEAADMSDLTASVPRPVAIITAFDDPRPFALAGGTDYVRKFNLTSREGEWVTRLTLRLPDPAVRGDVGEAVFHGPTPMSAPKPPQFIPQASHGARGTVRFRWLDNDEGAWIYCVTGCCSVEGGA